uniref:Uncharacterized protein n=1 Tax=Rhizophora mucronata TaxID=61149 RepID=A0A2P2J4N6_RHIMU
MNHPPPLLPPLPKHPQKKSRASNPLVLQHKEENAQGTKDNNIKNDNSHKTVLY